VDGIEELPIPDLVLSGTNKTEMARIWLVDNRQVVTLSDRLWDDPGAWGLMLVDLARHIGNAYTMRGWEKEEVLARVRKVMEAEWSSPTGSA
jgi:hypothetical protein